LLRSSTVFFTAAFTSSSVKSLVGPLEAGAAVSPVVGAAAGAGVITGAFVVGSAAITDVETAKHNAAAATVAGATEAKPRPDILYFMT
jgi:hypothetical protein